jgi:hypothetical protein
MNQPVGFVAGESLCVKGKEEVLWVPRPSHVGTDASLLTEARVSGNSIFRLSVHCACLGVDLYSDIPLIYLAIPCQAKTLT